MPSVPSLSTPVVGVPVVGVPVVGVPVVPTAVVESPELVPEADSPLLAGASSPQPVTTSAVASASAPVPLFHPSCRMAGI